MKKFNMKKYEHPLYVFIDKTLYNSLVSFSKKHKISMRRVVEQMIESGFERMGINPWGPIKEESEEKPEDELEEDKSEDEGEEKNQNQNETL